MILTQFFSDFLRKNICSWYSFELPRLVEAFQISTNYICFYKKKNRQKYTGCNLKTTKFLDCALIGACAVIRSITIFIMLLQTFKQADLTTCRGVYKTTG